MKPFSSSCAPRRAAHCRTNFKKHNQKLTNSPPPLFYTTSWTRDTDPAAAAAAAVCAAAPGSATLRPQLFLLNLYITRSQSQG